MDLNFALHEKQLEVIQSEARFKVCPAGRRAGKSFTAAVDLILKGLENVSPDGKPLGRVPVYYIAPTYDQAKAIMWDLLKELAYPVTKKVWDNTCVLELLNGRKIHIKGSDKPNSLRGVGLSHVVLDEYAFMRPEVFEMIILPALSDYLGSALIIGTPEGRNHFYDMYRDAKLGKLGNDWQDFHFCSLDNPYLPAGEVEAARARMSRAAFAQEYEASFDAQGGVVFNVDDFKIVKAFPSDPQASRYITMDPSGFANVDSSVKGSNRRLDRTALVQCEVHDDGDWYFSIKYGRWGIRETATRFLRTVQQFKPTSTGIEKGALLNSIGPYLEEEKRRFQIFPAINPLRHNNQAKNDRIIWALQGRAEHGRLHMVEGPWTKEFLEEVAAFPSKLVHDDGPDALAYIDQLASANHFHGDIPFSDDEYEPLDEEAGY